MNRFAASDALTKSLLTHMSVGILVYEADAGRCVLANQAAADILGEKIETLRQEKLQRLVPACRLAESGADDTPCARHEVKWRRGDDQGLTLDFFISRFDFEGKPHLICTVSDITERKRTQETLERERGLLRCLIDSASDLIFIKDQESVYRGCNKASETFVGMAESEQIGKTDFDFFDSAKAEEICAADRQVLTEGRPVHCEEWVTDADGQRLLMDTVKTPYYGPNGKPLGLVGIARDITERKHYEAVNAARLRLVHFADSHTLDELLEETLNEAEKLTGSRIGFYHFVHDDQKTLVLQNWSTRTKAEFCRAEGKGLHYPISEAGVWVDCVHQRKPIIHNDYAAHPHRKGMPAGHAEVIRQLVVPVMRGDKIDAIFGIGNKPSDYTAKDVEIVALLADLAWEVVKRKRAEEEIRRFNQKLERRVQERTAQLVAANEEMRAFTYTLSHDLRAPLRHIDGFVQLLRSKRGAAFDEQSRHYMAAISGAAQKMGLLVDDLLSFSHMAGHAVSVTPVDLASLVREIIQALEPDAAERTIDWRIGDLPLVRGDAAMLHMVLTNLIANALKFTRPRETARIEIGSQSGGDGETAIFVRDNGVGFDMAYADKLFGVFQRLHHTDEFEGTGIGLANVRRIIARHGGRTWAEGEVDRGATFYFSLPDPVQAD
jgi:PAS domain S-box-containing protein